MASVLAPAWRSPALAGRTRADLPAAWGALTGVAPLVLPNVGPLAAGAALVAGAPVARASP